MSGILVSPLGRSPGAVSGSYFALKENGYQIDKVVTVGTSHAVVLAASQNFLAPLFRHLGVIYDPIHLPEEELNHEKRSLMPYARMMGWEIERACREGDEVHVAVTGGRSGMGALAALAAQFYGASKLWHLWVPAEIELGGDADLLRGLVNAAEMVESAYLNPTVWGREAYDLVDLPFLDLSEWREALILYQKTGRMPDAGLLLTQALQKELGQPGEKLLDQLFPDKMTISTANEYMGLVNNYWKAGTADERNKTLVEIGELFQRTGIIEYDEKQKLLLLLNSNGSVEMLKKVIKKDRRGAWTFIYPFLTENKDVIATSTGLIQVVFKAMELWMKAAELS